ncbi:MAG: Hsp20/alpha crystallin family protein [Candidatus Yonathbacteria bacterium]|nr:Hsp20/alpha crystallin family protein [Candidatus Yonathbacteria bacterium]
MSKEKRSFFERLTGTVAVDGEEEVAKTTPKSGHGNTWAPEEADEGQLTVDVYQNGNDIVLQTMVAGVAPENLNISITRDMVTIKGRRDAPSNVSAENYFNKELYWGSFSRTVLLPQEIEPEEAEATQRHGLLTLRLPKVDKEKVREIKVKVV